MAIEQAPEINMFEGAIPGQSMASSPESKMAWDGPPQYAGIKEASEAIFLSLLEEENLTAILDLLENDTPVSEITSVLLLTGFSKGQYNPDLLMMLIEPVMYMIMAIADRFGIENVKIYKGEEEDYNEDFDEDITGQEIEDAKIESLKDIFNNKRISPDLRNTIENSEIAKKLESIDIDSLMARREEKPMPTSLLEQGK
jgi:hypothetical protein|tara:strand:- start:7632 stop:8228 length:597 start_codon:yes stop_codon:yes gene_type:complete